MSAPPCAALSPTGYACTLAKGHAGDHEARKASGRAHAFALGPVVATWPQVTFEQQCEAALDAEDRAAHEAVQRGDAAPEEVAERRGQMRVVR